MMRGFPLPAEVRGCGNRTLALAALRSLAAPEGSGQFNVATRFVDCLGGVLDQIEEDLNENALQAVGPKLRR